MTPVIMAERVRQLERTVKAAMERTPPGEHFAVSIIISEQNKEIIKLKKRIRMLMKKGRK